MSYEQSLVTHWNETSRMDEGERWSRAHPLPDGILFGWPYDYDMTKTHYHINPVFCENCGSHQTVWVPQGTRRPRTIANLWPCRTCAVVCKLIVGKWG